MKIQQILDRLRDRQGIGQQKAIVDMTTLAILEGELSSLVFGLVNEWAIAHQAELLANY